MERKKKINEKERGSFKFDYQELIEKNDLDIGELPEMMAMMIYKTDEHLKEALAKCTEGHCNSVILDLQPYADFILDELYSHYDERISGNLIEGDEPNEPEKVEESAKHDKQNSDLSLIIALTKQNSEQLANINELINKEKKSKKKKTFQSQLIKEKTSDSSRKDQRSVKELEDPKVEVEKKESIQSERIKEKTIVPAKEIQPEIKEVEEPRLEEEKKESIESILSEGKTPDPSKEIQPSAEELEEPKVEKEIIKPNHDRSDEEIILACSRETQEEFTEHDLRKRGFKGKLTNRYIQVGGFVLKKLLFQPYWEIIPTSEIIRKS
jgi:hypothetical protein